MDKKVSRKAIEYLKERKEDFIPLIYKGFRELKNKIINRLLYSETENRPLFHISLISESGNINLEKLGLNERQKTHEKSQLATLTLQPVDRRKYFSFEFTKNHKPKTKNHLFILHLTTIGGI